jgi:glycosyltransferase involved in cell wall biosynthesis
VNNSHALRILLAVHHFPSAFRGGAEWRAYRTARWLRSHGHDVQVIAIEAVDEGQEPGVRAEDTVYNEVPVRRLRFNLDLAADPLQWSYDNPWVEQAVADLLAEKRSDLLHLISGYLMGAGTIRAAREAGLPAVVTLTDYWFICPRVTLLRSNGQVCADATPLDCVRCLAEEKRRYRWPARLIPGLMDHLWSLPLAGKLGGSVNLAAIERRRRVLTEALGQLDLAICPSEFLRQVYIRAGVPAERLIYSRQGLALSGDVLPKMPSDELCIGYTGQLAEHKGVHLLIEAFKQLDTRIRPVTLMIYGDPLRFPRYVRRLRRLADNHPCIRFVGTYSYSDLGRMLSKLDVVVVPSIWYENSPNTILEAFAYRTPVVTSDLGGMSELVDHRRSGLLFAPGDVADLKEQLQRLVDEPELAGRLSDGVPPVRTLDQELEELVSLYKRVTQPTTKRVAADM